MADDKPSDEKPKFDPFHPAEPRLPGVPERKPPKPAATPPPQTEGGANAKAADATAAASPAWMQKLPPQLRTLPPAVLYGGAGAVVLVIVVVLWMALGSGDAPATESVATPAPAGSAPAASAPAAAGQPAEPPPEVVRLPAPVALTRDMARPWTAKKFIIQQSTGRVPAMVVRIPVGSAGSASGYWAFLATVPFGRCELELITDLKKLADEYNYRSNTPLVVDPCTQTLFHPLQMGTIGPGTYTRGEVIRGTALRPPVAIDIRIERGAVVAVRTE